MMDQRRTALILGAGALIMLGLAYASVPLYRLFCAATGFAGTPLQVAANKTQTGERWITVSFDGNVEQHLPWDFTPDQTSLRVKLGETALAGYHVHNHGTSTLVGTAAFNVQPDKIGGYFDKLQCFCFTQQVLKPGETAQLTVQFYVDPALATDSQTSDVQNITLSYTFFRAKDQTLAEKRP